MNHIKRKLFGWKESSAETYRHCYMRYGGSINMHPDVIDFIASRENLKVNYFHFTAHGEVIAAWPLINGCDPGIRLWNKYPVSYDEIVFPIHPEHKVFFPEKSNRLSPTLKDNLYAINYRLARKNKVCLIKQTFSAKFEKNRRNEFNRFIKAGGQCLDQSHFSASELADIYITLFNARFAGKVRCYDRQTMIALIHHLRHLVFGNVLLIDNSPCAFDLVLMAESAGRLYFDVPNGGVDTRYAHLSPGSLVMWKNVQQAKLYAEETAKPMTFSIGALTEEWNYKLRWANAFTTGKPFF